MIWSWSAPAVIGVTVNVNGYALVPVVPIDPVAVAVGLNVAAEAGAATPATTKPAARSVAPSALKNFVIQIV
jgi:hypothetical protein